MLGSLDLFKEAVGMGQGTGLGHQISLTQPNVPGVQQGLGQVHGEPYCPSDQLPYPSYLQNERNGVSDLSK